ncbi:MAG: alanine--tRNA ligase [Bacteroidota bacterium]
MTANEIRQQFFSFFRSKGHKIVPSAPIVNKEDPSLMFTNAGMNQFKDFFLGNKTPDVRRIADTQKCLRVSGKHNDLEEVGIDSYHHTMFEMLGNWSIGDYFKSEAISWAWELLTEHYGLAADRLFVSVFSGDANDGLSADEEAADLWLRYVSKDRILYFDRKDNFWEMGDVGPCGPCSEIHIDLRTDDERAKTQGKDLVNADHPLVIEIWNLVFIQFNRKADGSLEELPEKHIDTGMGFERLCMAIQGKSSNYDTDLFVPFIQYIEDETGQIYSYDYNLTAKKDIAFRVIVDHLRAVAFTIADGQLPSNTGAGYVIRRILRRAVRYYFSFLERKEPLLHLMIPLLAERFGEVFPELVEQQEFVAKIIAEEEKSFLRTLDGGLKRLSQLNIQTKLEGTVAFELYDTYGFPIDLTRLIGLENGWEVDEKGFQTALQAQKDRSRADAQKSAGDWIVVHEGTEVAFVGYDQHHASDVKILKYRTVQVKEKDIYQLVLDRTPFYAESGGQVGDQGSLAFGDERIQVLDTQKENDLIIHVVDRIPTQYREVANAQVASGRRELIENNHTATHLLHAALREVLGDHVAQRGSLVNDRQLRFDFSHFQKMTPEDIRRVEEIVNQKVRANIPLEESRSIPIAEAQQAGATMLFGEKYGDHVRMITFDANYSRELCGGCHVDATGEIGLFKIKSESAIAAGVRRIEALTARSATTHVNEQLEELTEIKMLFKSPVNTSKQIEDLLTTQKRLEKEIQSLKLEKVSAMKTDLLSRVEKVGDFQFLAAMLHDVDMTAAKSLSSDLEKAIEPGLVLLAIDNGAKANLQIQISRALVSDHLDASKMIKQISRHIQGGGGGQPFFATAGGKNPGGLSDAVQALRELIEKV